MCLELEKKIIGSAMSGKTTRVSPLVAVEGAHQAEQLYYPNYSLLTSYSFSQAAVVKGCYNADATAHKHTQRRVRRRFFFIQLQDLRFTLDCS